MNTKGDRDDKRKAELAASQDKFRIILDSVMAGIVLIDPEKHIIEDINSTAAEMFGADGKTMVGAVCHRFICPAEVGRCPITDLGQTVDCAEKALLIASGERIPIIKTIVPVEIGGRRLLVESFIYTSAFKQMEHKLIEAERKYRIILEEMNDAYFEVNLAGKFTFVNASVSRNLLYSADELLKMNFRTASAEEDHQALYDAFNQVFRTGQPNKGIAFRMIRKDGTTAFAETSVTLIKEQDGRASGFRCVGRDVTERIELENRLREMATHDTLTNLPNRVLLKDRFYVALALSRRKDVRLAIMALDLDKFKAINDTLGHAVGDELLRATGVRLSESVRRSDTISRVGGDEFVAMISEIVRVEEAEEVAQRILTALRRPFIIDGHTLNISTSIGIAVYPEHGDSIDLLLKNADTALYQVKERGRDDYRVFTPG